jgi:hypothetical protein
MAVSFEIVDGSPIWASPAIIPASVPPPDVATAPAWADPQSNPASTAPRVDVYVQVHNTGSGPIPCPIGLWGPPVPFSQQVNAGGLPQVDDLHGWRFRAAGSGDAAGTHDTLDRLDTSTGAPTLVPPHFAFPVVTAGRKCWGWSPDGHFFALAYEPTSGAGTNWHLMVVALDDALLLDGTPTSPPTMALPATMVQEYPTSSSAAAVAYTIPFTRQMFGWVGSNAIFTHGDVGTDEHRYLFRFRVSATAWGYESIPAGSSSAAIVASPCGSQIAFVEAGVPITWWSTSASRNPSALHSGMPVTLTPGPGASITTNTHTALGVTVQPVTNPPPVGPSATIDDPDDTESFGGFAVHVDRVLASTLPTANWGVRLVGDAIAGVIPTSTLPGGNYWVQVPNRVGWDRLGESHWCLLAQAFYANAGLPRPWNGQAASPVPFPVSAPAPGNERCAQRNIHIQP